MKYYKYKNNILLFLDINKYDRYKNIYTMYINKLNSYKNLFNFLKYLKY